MTTIIQIPPTDAACRWDWRTLQCTPACLCSYQQRRGDYHVGRSCRYRTTTTFVVECNDDDDAQHVGPIIPRRVLSLVQQTASMLRAQIVDRTRIIGSVWRSSREQFTAVQQRVCQKEKTGDAAFVPAVLLLCRGGGGGRRHRSKRKCEHDDDTEEERRNTSSSLASFWKKKSETLFQAEDTWDM